MFLFRWQVFASSCLQKVALSESHGKKSEKLCFLLSVQTLHLIDHWEQVPTAAGQPSVAAAAA